MCKTVLILLFMCYLPHTCTHTYVYMCMYVHRHKKAYVGESAVVQTYLHIHEYMGIYAACKYIALLYLALYIYSLNLL